MNISVFGLGYVGCVSLACLAKNGHYVVGVDINEQKVKSINSGVPTIIEPGLDKLMYEAYELGRISATEDSRAAIMNTDISIICVGTPSTNVGHLDLNNLYNLVTEISQHLSEKEKFHIISIRSTVKPGTSEDLIKLIETKSEKKINKDFAVVYNPEFLREGSAIQDYYNPPYILIGSNNEMYSKEYSKIYNDIDCEIILSEFQIAEIMKYLNNSFHAMKVSFANEVGNICKSLGINSREVMDIFVKDSILNISKYYLKPGFAYGGSCLPKDLKGLVTLAHDNYIKTPLLSSIEVSNNIQINRAFEIITIQNRNNIAFLGLSFKAGTDDLRNSPTVFLVESLLGKGYSLKLYDYNLNLSLLNGTNKEFIEKKIPHLGVLLCENIDEVLVNSEIIVVATNETFYYDYLIKVKNKIIIDLVGIKNDELVKNNEYIGINW